jgi:hypothetical protein
MTFFLFVFTLTGLNNHLAPNWKSLCQPAVLPLSSSYCPTLSDLHANYFEYNHTLLLIPNLNDYQNDPTLLIEEMVCQRMAHDYQLLIEDRFAHSLTPNSHSSSISTSSSTIIPPSSISSTLAPSISLSTTHSPSLNLSNPPSSSSAQQATSFENSQTLTLYFSIRSQIHRIVLNKKTLQNLRLSFLAPSISPSNSLKMISSTPSSKSDLPTTKINSTITNNASTNSIAIHIKRYIHKKVFNEQQNLLALSTKYKYFLYSPYSQRFHITFRTFEPSLNDSQLPWSEIDEMLCGGQTSQTTTNTSNVELKQEMKYRRIQLVFHPFFN